MAKSANNPVAKPNQNRCTIMAGGRQGKQWEMERHFITHYPTFREYCARHQEVGLAVIAIDEQAGCVASTQWVRANIHSPRALIIGRHSTADMPLAGCDSLSLRHLAVVIEPLKTYEAHRAELSYQVLDLRTGAGMVDETGRKLRGLRSEGPTFVRVENFVLMFLITGDSSDWPASPHLAWSFLPERVYLDERTGFAEGSVRFVREAPTPEVLQAHPKNMRTTQVMRTLGAIGIGESLLNLQESRVGILEIQSRHGCVRLEVGSDALREGILLGRYPDRCGAASVLAVDRVSRVHLLLVAIGGVVYAIDAASTNGTTVWGAANQSMRLVAMTSGTRLVLGGSGAVVRWQWSQGG